VKNHVRKIPFLDLSRGGTEKTKITLFSYGNRLENFSGLKDMLIECKPRFCRIINSLQDPGIVCISTATDGGESF